MDHTDLTTPLLRLQIHCSQAGSSDTGDIGHSSMLPIPESSLSTVASVERLATKESTQQDVMDEVDSDGDRDGCSAAEESVHKDADEVDSDSDKGGAPPGQPEARQEFEQDAAQGGDIGSFERSCTPTSYTSASCAIVRPSAASRWPMDIACISTTDNRPSSVVPTQSTRVLRPRSNITRPSKRPQNIIPVRKTRAALLSKSKQSKLFKEYSGFVSKDDDDETLWAVKKIIAENTRSFKVVWEGLDPRTKRPWKPSWVKKNDCTPDIVAEWRKACITELSDHQEFAQTDYHEDLYSELDEVDGEIRDSEGHSDYHDSDSDDSSIDSVYMLMDKQILDTNELCSQKSPSLGFEGDDRVKPAPAVLHQLGFRIVALEELEGLALLVCTHCEGVVYATLKNVQDHLRLAHWRHPGFIMPADEDCSAALTTALDSYDLLQGPLDRRFPNYLPPLPHIRVESGWSCCVCVDGETRFCALSLEEITVHYETCHPGPPNPKKYKEYCYISTLVQERNRWHIVREPELGQNQMVRAAPKILHDLGFVILLLQDQQLPNLLVCTLCQCAVLPGGKSLRRHIRKDLQSKTSQPIPTASQCAAASEAIAERYNIPIPKNVPKLRVPNHRPPLPFIRHVLGWSCPLCPDDRQFCCASRRAIEHHQRTAHPDSPIKLRRKDRCRISSLFSACLQWYIVSCGDDDYNDVPQQASPIDSLRNMYEEFDTVQGLQIRVPVHNAFLVQVGWTQQYDAGEANHLLMQVALPAKDDPLLPDLRKAVSEYLQAIKACLQSSPSAYLQPRRWINCLLAEPEQKTRPFENHQTHASFLRCERALTSFIAFVVRLTLAYPERVGRGRVCEVDQNVAAAAQACRRALSANESTSEHLHSLTHSLVRQDLEAGYCCLAEVFVRLMCLQDDGNYREPQHASDLIAYLSWTFRACEFWHLHQKSKEGQNLESLSKEAHGWLNTVNFKTTPFAVIRRIFLVARRVASNAPPKVVISWSGNILTLNSLRLDISLLRPFVQKHLSATEAFFHTRILKGAILWEPDYATLVDDFHNREDGYSFVSDPTNGFSTRRRILLEALTTGEHRASFVLDTAIGPRLNSIGCRAWLQDCHRVAGFMFQDMVLSWGVPSRYTELATANPFNLGQRLTGTDRWVIHALPPRLSRLFALYLAYVLPTINYMAQELLDQETSTLYKSFLFTSLGKVWTTSQFVHLLRQVTNDCFGRALGALEWRHTAIAIGRKEFAERFSVFENAVRLQGTRNAPTSILDAAAGHTTSVANRHYAVPYDVLLRIPGAVQEAFIAFSREWFTWLGLK